MEMGVGSFGLRGEETQALLLEEKTTWLREAEKRTREAATASLW